MPIDPANVTAWQAAPGGGPELDGDPVRNNNGLDGDSLSPQSVTGDYRMVGKHGQIYDHQPTPDPFCGYMDTVPNADDPNIGSGRGISPGPFAKG